MCDLLSGAVACNQRIDCRWSGTQCFNAATDCTVYTLTPTPQINCTQYECYWDADLQACYNSLAEVVAIYPCSSWSNYPPPNSACGMHGCSLDYTGLICHDATPATGNGTQSVSSELRVSMVNPYTNANSFIFNVQVWLPDVLYNLPPVWTNIFLGNGVPAYGDMQFITPGWCNNLLQFNYSQSPSLYVPVNDPTATQTYLDSWINTNHNMHFPTNSSTLGPLLYELLGYTAAVNGSTFSTVSIDGSGDWRVHQLSFNLNDAVTNCWQYGLKQLLLATDSLYTIPITVVQRQHNNAYLQSTTVFYLDYLETGQLVSVSASSQYVPTLLQQAIVTETSSCPAGWARLHITYLLQIGNVFTPGMFVGPRTAADIVWTSPEVGDALYNCYQEQVLNVTYLYTINSQSYTQIVTRTNCRPIDNSGQSFNNCSFAASVDKLADLNSTTGVYPSYLNHVHDLFVYEYLCPLAASLDNSWANCTKTVISSNGWPDHLRSSIQLSITPGQTITVQFDVYAGLLPSPFIMDLSRIDTLSQTPNTPINSPDKYDSNLQWNGQFTFVIGISDPTLRKWVNLTMDTYTLFRIDGLDTNATVIPGLPSLYIAQVFPYMTYVPRALVPLCAAHGCRETPATANQTAYDSFSIPVLTLRTLLPANGYAVSVAYKYNLPTSIDAVTSAVEAPVSGELHLMDSGHNRHHSFHAEAEAQTDLQTATTKAMHTQAADAAPLYTVHTGSYLFRFLINDATNPHPITVADIQFANNTNSSLAGFQGAQVAFSMYVAYNPTEVDASNHTQLLAFARTRIVIAVAATLHIATTQVVDVDVSDTPLDNSIGTQSVGGGGGGGGGARRQLMSVIETTLYVSLVILANETVTSNGVHVITGITASDLATVLVSSNTLTILEANMVSVGLQLNNNIALTQVPVYILSPTFVDVSTGSTTVTVSSSSNSDDYSPRFYAGVSVIAFLFVAVCFLLLFIARRNNGYLRLGSQSDSTLAIRPHILSTQETDA